MTNSDNSLAEVFSHRWEVIDAQSQFYSYNYFRLLAQVVGQYGDVDMFMRRQARLMKIDLPTTEPERLAGRWVRELDRFGVSRLCLMAGSPGDEYSITQAIRSYPDRLIGFIEVNPHLVVAEEVLEHAVRVGGVRGVYLHPCRHRFNASDELVYPIYRMARRYHLPVYLDYGPPCCPIAADWGAKPSHDERFNVPQQIHFAASDFSSVPFVIARFLPEHLRELLRMGLLCPNVHLCTSTITELEDDTLGAGGLLSILETFLKAFGPRRLLFGTGSGLFPDGWRREIFRKLLNAMSGLGLPEREVSLILGGNIKRLLRLKDSGMTYIIAL